jgi:hypothetical protein
LKISIEHEFDAPLDAVELAILSPDLVQRIANALTAIETVEQIDHRLEAGVLTRVWSYRANVPMPAFARGAFAREILAWRETTEYSLKTHASRWSIEPDIKPDWRRYFHSDGIYRLDRAPEGRTRRTVEGTIEIRVALVGHLAERMIANEVRKTFDAEAEALRELATVR